MLEGQPGYDVALDESYRATGPKPRILVETVMECLPHPRRWHLFLSSTKPDQVRKF
jgi:hypothetical protein